MKTFAQFSLTEGVYDKSRFKAIFIVGAPGSGKTTIGKKATAGLGYKYISSDKVFEYIMAKDNQHLNFQDKTEDDYSNDQATRRDARQIMYREKDLAVSGRMGLLIDTPGYGDYVLKDKEFLESKGYDTFMIFVRTSMETSLSRNAARDRKVPVDAVKSMYSGVMKNLQVYGNAFDYGNFVVVNNDGSEDDVNKQIEEIWKDINKFTNAPVKNRLAKDWIQRHEHPLAVQDRPRHRRSSPPPKNFANFTPSLFK